MDAADSRCDGDGSAPHGSEHAKQLSALFERHACDVVSLLRRLGVPASDLDDVAQEVFLVVHRQLPGFEGRSSVRTWLFGICLRTVSTYRRRAYRRRERPVAVIPESPAAGQPEEALLWQEALRALADELASMPAGQRDVYVLFEIEQLSMPEVARVVRCRLSTAYTRLHSGRARVRRRLAPLIAAALSAAAWETACPAAALAHVHMAFGEATGLQIADRTLPVPAPSPPCRQCDHGRRVPRVWVSGFWRLPWVCRG